MMLCYFLQKTLFTYLERECAHTQARVGDGQKERESQVESPLSVEPHAGLYLMTLRSEPIPRVRHWTDCTTQAPYAIFIEYCVTTQNNVVQGYIVTRKIFTYIV